MEHATLLTLAGIAALGIACQWIAWRVRVPAILPLLVVGFAVGPLLNWLHPRELLGELFFPFISLSVAVILFEGALTLEFREIRHVQKAVRRLISIGALVTWLGGGAAAHYLLHLPWSLALLFGALIVVTGPTVIGPLLRNVRPTANVSSVLKWESILIDPLGALLAVVVFDIIVAEGPAGDFRLQALVTFSRIVITGMVLGVLGGLFVREVVRRHAVPDYLRELFVLATVLTVFALSDIAQSESGLLSVTVMGILLANSGLRELHELWHFKERISILLISTLFILLAANVDAAAWRLLDWPRVLLLLAAVLFVLRPLSVLVSTIGSPLTWEERAFLGWIAPRGIVAASVSSLFAARLQDLGFENASVLAPLTFIVIVATVVLHGGTARWVASLLGVAEAAPQGFLFMGANRFARALAAALQEAGFRVLLVDTNFRNVSRARMQGLEVFQGNALDESVQEELNFSGLGRFFALTSNDEANALACLEYRLFFGSKEVYQLPPSPNSGTAGGFAPARFGRLLFSPRAVYDALDEAVRRGATVKITALTPEFTFADYRQMWGDRALPLLAFQPEEKAVMVATTDAAFNPPAGWHVVALVHETRPVLPAEETA